MQVNLTTSQTQPFGLCTVGNLANNLQRSAGQLRTSSTADSFRSTQLDWTHLLRRRLFAVYVMGHQQIITQVHSSTTSGGHAGEPRNITDPANRPFMESITKGECPAELDPGNRSQQVSVNLVRSEKPYEAPPKPKYKAFSGSGQTLAGAVFSLPSFLPSFL